MFWILYLLLGAAHNV